VDWKSGDGVDDEAGTSIQHQATTESFFIGVDELDNWKVRRFEAEEI